MVGNLHIIPVRRINKIASRDFGTVPSSSTSIDFRQLKIRWEFLLRSARECDLGQPWKKMSVLRSFTILFGRRLAGLLILGVPRTLKDPTRPARHPSRRRGPRQRFEPAAPTPPARSSQLGVPDMPIRITRSAEYRRGPIGGGEHARRTTGRTSRASPASSSLARRPTTRRQRRRPTHTASPTRPHPQRREESWRSPIRGGVQHGCPAHGPGQCNGYRGAIRYPVVRAGAFMHASPGSRPRSGDRRTTAVEDSVRRTAPPAGTPARDHSSRFSGLRCVG
jgi:hypothetical protein